MILKLKKYTFAAKVGLLNSMAYTINYIFDSIFYVFIIFVFLSLWTTVYGQGSRISGYSLNMLLWYLIITELITLSAVKVFENLSNEIRGGNIAYQLNKPYNLVLFQIATGFGQLTVKFIINFVVSILLGIIFIGTLDGLNLKTLVLCIIPFFLGVLLNTLMLVLSSLSAFWMEENKIFYHLNQKLVLIFGMFMPLEFYPQWLQNIIKLTPFPYITYGPAKLCVDFTAGGFINILINQIAFIGIVSVIIGILFKKGVKMLNVAGG